MNADGSGRTRLTEGPLRAHVPTWSPDGSRIAFAGIEPSGIHVMNADGSDQIRLTTDGFLPDWSPDGTKIALQTEVFTASYPVFGIDVMNADGTGRTHIIDGGGWPD